MESGKKKRKKCKFCNIIERRFKLLYFDEDVVIFRDIKSASAKEHILVCPILHIPDISYLKPEHLNLLEKIEKIGREFLTKLYPKDNYLCGFHAPPLNSVDHLHLHYFVLPFSEKFYAEIKYGKQLTLFSTVYEKLKE